MSAEQDEREQPYHAGSKADASANRARLPTAHAVPAAPAPAGSSDDAPGGREDEDDAYTNVPCTD